MAGEQPSYAHKRSGVMSFLDEEPTAYLCRLPAEIRRKMSEEKVRTGRSYNSQIITALAMYYEHCRAQ